MKDVYIYDAVRTPRGKGRKDGSLHEVTAVRLSTTVLNAIKSRNALEGHAVEDVVWGNVTQVGEQGACLARTAVLASDLDEAIPGLSINRFCASGLEAVNLAANQIAGGAGSGYIAGGVESMSRVPMMSDGGAIAVDPSVAMDQYFEEGADFISFKSADEFWERFSELRNNKPLRIKLRQSASARAQGEHLQEHRLSELISMIKNNSGKYIQLVKL